MRGLKIIEERCVSEKIQKVKDNKALKYSNKKQPVKIGVWNKCVKSRVQIKNLATDRY